MRQEIAFSRDIIRCEAFSLVVCAWALSIEQSEMKEAGRQFVFRLYGRYPSIIACFAVHKLNVIRILGYSNKMLISYIFIVFDHFPSNTVAAVNGQLCNEHMSGLVVAWFCAQVLIFMDFFFLAVFLLNLILFDEVFFSLFISCAFSFQAFGHWEWQTISFMYAK